MLQPLSAEQLYERAKPLMESNDVVQWQDADRKYISELEERYPNHPYKKEIADLHDRMALHKASARARLLSGPLAKPGDEVESLYMQAATMAAEAEKTGGDDLAAQTWQNLAETLRSSYTAERGWFLLAQQNQAGSQAQMERRRQEALNLLGNAKAAEVQNNLELAHNLRLKLIDQYAQYRYLAPIVEMARAALPTSTETPEPETPETRPQPAAETETTPSKPEENPAPDDTPKPSETPPEDDSP